MVGRKAAGEQGEYDGKIVGNGEGDKVKEGWKEKEGVKNGAVGKGEEWGREKGEPKEK